MQSRISHSTSSPATGRSSEYTTSMSLIFHYYMQYTQITTLPIKLEVVCITYSNAVRGGPRATAVSEQEFF